MTSLQENRPAAVHFGCLDVLRIKAERLPADDAVLLEVWDQGAVLQIDSSMPEGSAILIFTRRNAVAAKVHLCEADGDFGYLVYVDINPSNEWFPNGYAPAWPAAADSQCPSELGLQPENVTVASVV